MLIGDHESSKRLIEFLGLPQGENIFEFKAVELADGVVELCVHVNSSLIIFPVRNLMEICYEAEKC